MVYTLSLAKFINRILLIKIYLSNFPLNGMCVGNQILECIISTSPYMVWTIKYVWLRL